MIDPNREAMMKELSYNDDTGKFTWKISPALNVFIGNIAGSKNNLGYIKIRYRKVSYFAHRIVFFYKTGKWPDKFVDHINHDTSDNRWCNLREADSFVNGKNVKLGSLNRSGVMGVSWHNRDNIWRATIGVSKKQIHIGSYADFFEAVCARKSLEFKLNFHENHGGKYD